MSDRYSQIILLCEDRKHASLVCEYLKECGASTTAPYLRRLVASEMERGGNVSWVLREFPRQLQACRQRHSTHANTLLVVVVDADDFEVGERQAHLAQSAARTETDPLAILIPKRHVETWIRCALGAQVNEIDDYKRPEPKKAEVRAAAKMIYGWARENPAPQPTCVPSLKNALAEWRKVKV